MFVNISNHPSSFWSDIQLGKARLYGMIVDIPFPAISATANEESVSSLADEYAEKIISRFNPKEDVCHVMGELCFCFILIRRLQEAGFRCVASTSERMVQEYEHGYKQVLFDFVRFREYEDLNK